MLESACVAAVLPLTLPAFPGLIFPQLSVGSAVATLRVVTLTKGDPVCVAGGTGMGGWGACSISC